MNGVAAGYPHWMEEDNHIADPRTRAFVAALGSFEQDGGPDELIALFADDATLTRLDARGEHQDVEGFWRQYRNQFDRGSTTFCNAVEAPTQVALEWDSNAVLAGGRPITYSGVTVLYFTPQLDHAHSRSAGRDGAETARGVVARLRTYYDTAAFVAAPSTQA